MEKLGVALHRRRAGLTLQPDIGPVFAVGYHLHGLRHHLAQIDDAPQESA